MPPERSQAAPFVAKEASRLSYSFDSAFLLRVESLMTRRAKIISAIIIVSLILTAGCLYALPYITLYQIKEAAEQNNPEKLARYIDFNAVRQDLKEQLKTFVAVRRETIRKTAPVLEMIGGELLGRVTDTMVDRVLDTLVTPAGLDELMRGKIILGQVFRGEKKLEDGKTRPGEPPPEVSFKYESVSRFIVEIKNQADPNKKVKLVLTRRGLKWKLTALKLPLDSIPWPNIQ
jgi:hypothetical protein